LEFLARAKPVNPSTTAPATDGAETQENVTISPYLMFISQAREEPELVAHAATEVTSNKLKSIFFMINTHLLQVN